MDTMTEEVEWGYIWFYIIVDGYASLFNCTTAVRASDSMTASMTASS